MTHPGEVFTSQKTFSQTEFNRFARLSGDVNPIHVDPEFSARTRFGRTVSHGMLLYTVICGALEKFFPGAMPLEQDLMFPHPTYTGEAVTVQLEVLRVNDKQVTLKTWVIKPDGLLGLEGQAVLLLP